MDSFAPENNGNKGQFFIGQRGIFSMMVLQ